MLEYSYIYIVCAFACLFEANAMFVTEPGPVYPASMGRVWPKPQVQRSDNTYFTISPSEFYFKPTLNTCSIMDRAVVRCLAALNRLDKIAHHYQQDSAGAAAGKDENYLGAINELHIELTQPCEEFPQADMIENYNLTISNTPKLTSESIWGIVRGLETFAQLAYWLEEENSQSVKGLRINTTSIIDYPQYSHRGLLLNTSAHFISNRNILRTLDAMAMNKMNVFHWHIVGDASFPYRSKRFPEMSRLGAFHPALVYTIRDIQRIIEYASYRGIRVVPEFNVPAHTRSWGASYPNVLTKCYNSSLVAYEPVLVADVTGLGPLDPTKNATHKLLRDLYQEVLAVFKDEYVHVGGGSMDNFECWKSNPRIQEYLGTHRLFTFENLYAHFMQKVIEDLKVAKIIVRQDVFDAGVSLGENTIVQVWDAPGKIKKMVDILKAGHKVVYSSSFLLDRSKTNFGVLYKADPRQMVFEIAMNLTLDENIAGGEACLWGKGLDDSNIFSRTWPMASAVAEVLWSSVHKTDPDGELPAEVHRRAEEHACRMRRRGVPGAPAHSPGYCLL